MANLLEHLMSKNIWGGKATKQRFGELMHDDSIEEERKLKILEDVQLRGGYEKLDDPDEKRNSYVW